MRRFLATIAVLAVVGVFGWLNFDTIGPVLGIETAATAETTQVDTLTLGAEPEQRHRFVLIDPSTSTDTSFRESMKNDIISSLLTYVPPKPAEPKLGVPSLVGLQLTLRLVSTHSLAYGQANVAISIPSVPTLPPRPDMAAPGALDPGGSYATWKDAEAEWSTKYDLAVQASAIAVEAVRSLNLNTDQQSGILAGAAALALLAPEQGDVAFAVLSDLDENQGQEPANFNGHPILAVQPDPVGDVGRWDALFNTFTSWAMANGSGEITRVRPELAATAIENFIKGN